MCSNNFQTIIVREKPAGGSQRVKLPLKTHEYNLGPIRFSTNYRCRLRGVRAHKPSKVDDRVNNAYERVCTVFVSAASEVLSINIPPSTHTYKRHTYKARCGMDRRNTFSFRKQIAHWHSHKYHTAYDIRLATLLVCLETLDRTL